MRKLLSLLAVGFLAVAGQASAAALTSATFAFQLGTLPGAVFPGSGATGTATSNLSATLDAGTAFNGQFTTTVPTTAAAPITVIQVIITKNAAGNFTGGSPTTVGGNAAFQGTANIYGLSGFPSLPLLAVPLNVGTPTTTALSGGGVNITSISAGWTAGTAAVTGLSPTGPAATQMGSNALTPNGAGTLVLVTPIKILTNIAGNLAAFGTLTLSYVPEPGTLLLLGLGVAGLAAIGRRRM